MRLADLLEGRGGCPGETFHARLSKLRADVRAALKPKPTLVPVPTRTTKAPTSKPTANQRPTRQSNREGDLDRHPGEDAHRKGHAGADGHPSAYPGAHRQPDPHQRAARPGGS